MDYSYSGMVLYEIMVVGCFLYNICSLPTESFTSVTLNEKMIH